MTSDEALMLEFQAGSRSLRCGICHEDFSDYNAIVPDHKNPKGMGGA
jgi:hypothetical protein